MPKVSVIVPIYRVEKYIERCARSLFEQTLDDMEYIFVDDCSPDNSVQILENVLKEYPNRKDQTKIVRMPTNSGQAAVRRHGIQLATGDYIIHCDSDDWVDVAMYETLYCTATKGNCDIVICDYSVAFSEIKYQHIRQSIPTDNIVLIKEFLKGNIHGSVWNKLIHNSLYANIIFYPKDNMREDLVLTIQLVLKANSIIHIPCSYYYYFNNEVSISKISEVRGIQNRFYQSVNNADLIFKCLYINKLVPCFLNDIRALKYNIKIEACGGCSDLKFYKNWKKTYRELHLRELKYSTYSFKSKIKYILTYFGVFQLCKRFIIFN